MGRPCTSIAYPYGDADDRVIAAAGAAGYRAAALLPHRWPQAAPLAYPRAGIYHRDGPAVFRLKTSPNGQQLRRRLGR